MRKRPGEASKTIPDFPEYEVTIFGRVYNLVTGREMVLSPTQQGDLTVGLVRNGIQYRRSVKVLVAEAFVRGKTVIFDTPVQVDGNKENLHYMNIEWRPRWFAWEYTHQFNNIQPWYHRGPILDVVNNLQYDSVIQASVATASLAKHIYAAIGTNTAVFPGGEIYVYI